MSLLELQGISKYYNNHQVLTDVNLVLEYKSRVCITGKSGSGKSSILNIISGIDSFNNGLILWEGEDISEFSNAQLSNMRKNIGFVYQAHYLIEDFTALDNIIISGVIKGLKPQKAEALALELLYKLGILDLKHMKPSQLSGGQRRMVSLARSLVPPPKLIIADEPSADLDDFSSQVMLCVLFDFKEAMLVSSHDDRLVNSFEVVYEIRDSMLMRCIH